MEFLKLFMLKWALLTPWFLYIGSVFFGISCIWEKGSDARKRIAIAMLLFGTVIMAILIWPDNYKAMAKLMEATYYFPKEGR